MLKSGDPMKYCQCFYQKFKNRAACYYENYFVRNFNHSKKPDLVLPKI